MSGFTIASGYGHLAAIYSHSDALTIGGRDKRLAFLHMACADLSRVVRKNQTHLYSIALAQAFAWFCCLAEDLFRAEGGRVLAGGMATKYPAGECAYCHHIPCECSQVNRKPFKGRGHSESRMQERWTLEHWQFSLAKVYGQANNKIGVEQALNRLFEELGEVSMLLNHGDGVNDRLSELEQKLARELSDVLAWIFAVSTLLEVRLESAVRQLYDTGCPVCDALPCECKNFEKKPKSGDLAHRFMGADEVQQYLTIRQHTTPAR